MQMVYDLLSKSRKRNKRGVRGKRGGGGGGVLIRAGELQTFLQKNKRRALIRDPRVHVI